MQVPVSLRSTEQEQVYQRAKKLNLTIPIDQIPGANFYSLKQLDNMFPLDLVFEKTDMLLARRRGLLGFIHWWMVLGFIYYRNKHDGFDQLILNFKHSQSQPQIPHAHRAKFYTTREQFKTGVVGHSPAQSKDKE